MIDVLQRLNDAANSGLGLFRNDSLKQKEMEEALKKAEEKQSFTEKIKKAAWYTVGASVVIIGGIAFIVPAAGFTSGGVLGGSMAAAWQSTLGGTIASGSLFATFQSVGAAGIAFTTKAGIVVTSGVASLYTAFSEKKTQENE